MKSFSIGVFASVLALVSALPLEKKDMVVETVVEKVVKTVEATTTVWVSPGQTATHAAVAQKQADIQEVPKPVAAPSTTSTSSTSTAPPPPPTTSSDPAPIAAYQAPTTTSTSTTPPPPPPPPTSSTVPSYVAPAVPASSAAAPAQSSSSSGTTSGGSCKDGGPCSGDITVYDTTAGLAPEVFMKSGFGACGWLNNGTSEDVFALAHEMMGSQSNGNPYCGRMATITLNGKSATGKLVDKCGGCQGQSIDLSDHLFAALGADTTTGRYHDIEWHFTS